MTINQDMLLYLQHRVTALAKEVEDKNKQLNKLQERCEYLESERQHLLDQLLDKPFVTTLR